MQHSRISSYRSYFRSGVVASKRRDENGRGGVTGFHLVPPPDGPALVYDGSRAGRVFSRQYSAE